MENEPEAGNDALARLIGTVTGSPVIDKGGYQYFVHPLTDGIPSIEPWLLRDAATCMVSLLPPRGAYDLVLTAEAMGIPMASAISLEVGKPVSIVRKRSYGLPGEVTVGQTTGYSNSDLSFNLPAGGGRLVIVDDVLSTAGTLKTLGKGARDAGWTIVSAVVIFDKFTGDREALELELGFPVRTLIMVEVRNGSCLARPSMR